MNRSEKFNFYLPQNVDPIDVSNFDYNFEIIDENLITEEQELTSTQKANARANLDLGGAALQTVANNLTTSSAGSVLDARQGKALGDRTTANESAVSSIRNSIAIVASGNTHGAITAGQYVYVHSHSSLNEGLYTANSNISANATLSTSNLTAVSGGGLNALDRKVPVIVSATATIGTINANTYASGNVDVDIPVGTNGVKSVIPRYTSAGFPIAGAYPVSGASSGKSRVLVGVYNFTSSSVSNVTATVDVVFMY